MKNLIELLSAKGVKVPEIAVVAVHQVLLSQIIHVRPRCRQNSLLRNSVVGGVGQTLCALPKRPGVKSAAVAVVVSSKPQLSSPQGCQPRPKEVMGLHLAVTSGRTQT